MTEREKLLEQIAGEYRLQMLYAFGSRAKEAFEFLKGTLDRLAPADSDLDIAVKPRQSLTVEEKVEIALALEDLFGVLRVDLIVLPEVPTFVAYKGVTGELLYAEDDTLEAEYQLYIMRKAAELLPYEEARIKFVLRS